MSETEQSKEQGKVQKAKSEKAPFEIGSVEAIMEAAPKDLVTEVIDVPEWGCSVRVRSFSAAQQAKIKQASLDLHSEKGTDVLWLELELAQFVEGVTEPKFTEEQARKLQASSGVGFARVIGWLDTHAGASKEELRAAREEFRAPAD